MTKRFPLFLLSALLIQPAMAENGDLLQQYAAEAKQLALELPKAMKPQMKAAAKRGGFEHAVEFCSLNAQALTLGISKLNNAQISRTSLKYRNPANAPTDWQRSVLKLFEQQRQQGKSLAQMEHGELFQRQGKTAYRYMKAIAVQGVCLNCHGVDIAPAVQAKIDEKYPTDKATGFAQGDLRGAFSVVFDIED